MHSSLDLHFGLGTAIAINLLRRKAVEPARETLLEALLRDSTCSGIDETQIALVLVSWDLHLAGRRHSFRMRRPSFEGLGEELGLHSSQIVIVPGNHDLSGGRQG